ncbi:MAG: hypothetical protein IH964_13220 [Candidatus Dadabacteria bacterium]|nr:hypothetical protein [Candidatus Dadabacteria bacterium]
MSGEKEDGEELFCFLADSEDDYENCINKIREAVIQSRPRLETEPEETMKPTVRPKDAQFKSGNRKILSKTQS